MADALEPPFDGKKLFTVEIEQSVVVLAADEAEAEEIAKEQATCGGDIEWNDADYSVYETNGAIPADWVNAFPFGMDSGMKQQTCDQIQNAWLEYQQSLPPTKAELEAMGQQSLIAEA